jgi:hypothetical protein
LDQDPLPIRDVGKKFLQGMATFHNRALGVARGAGHAAFAGERHEAAIAAGLTAEARDAEARDAALEEGPQGCFVAGVRWGVALSRAQGEISLQRSEDRPVERAGGGVARAIR